jgi:hypothetical protein
VWSQEDRGKYFLYFLAESPELEVAMWNDFFDWLCCLPYDYRVYQYANYEKTALEKLAEKHRTSIFLNTKAL